MWTDHFRRTGTYHMLVIDGLHITVLAAFLLFLLRLCFLPEITALAITASGAWLYALVSGWNAPAVRAAGGFTLYVVARYFYRRGRLLNLLAAVAIVYLIYDPGQLFEAGFQLSFLAVAAIGAFAIPILEATSDALRARPGEASTSAAATLAFRRASHSSAWSCACWPKRCTTTFRFPTHGSLRGLALAARVCSYAYELAVISTAIQIGLALPMAIYFHRISLTGILGQHPRSSAAGAGGAAGLHRGLHWVAFAGGDRRMAARQRGEKVADWHLRIRTGLARGRSAAMARRRLLRRACFPWRGRCAGRAAASWASVAAVLAALRADLLASVSRRQSIRASSN